MRIVSAGRIWPPWYTSVTRSRCSFGGSDASSADAHAAADEVHRQVAERNPPPHPAA
jgi:hypothetical protein